MDVFRLRPVLTTSLTPRRRPSHPVSTHSPNLSPDTDQQGRGSISPGRSGHPCGLICITTLSKPKDPWNAITPWSPSQVKMSNGRPLTPGGRWKPLVAFSPCEGGERAREWLQGRKQRARSIAKDKSTRPLFKLTLSRLPSRPCENSPIRYVQIARCQPNSALERTKVCSKPQSRLGRRTGEDWKPRPEKILRSSSGISGWNQDFSHLP